MKVLFRVLLAAGAVLLLAAILFPIFAQAKMGNRRWSRANTILQRQKQARLHRQFDGPIDAAIKKDDLAQVRILWEQSKQAGMIPANSEALRVAKYEVDHGLKSEAIADVKRYYPIYDSRDDSATSRLARAILAKARA